MAETIDGIREQTQARLHRLEDEIGRLQAALAALGAGNGSRPQHQQRRLVVHPAPAGRRGPRSAHTKESVLADLREHRGQGRTAQEVASATGLGRASVSTTLSKLARVGVIARAERGYRVE